MRTGMLVPAWGLISALGVAPAFAVAAQDGAPEDAPPAPANAEAEEDLSVRTVTDATNAEGEPIDLSPNLSPGVKASYEHWLLIVQQYSVTYEEQLDVNRQILAEMRRRFEVEVLETTEEGGAVVSLRMERLRWRAEPPRGPAYGYDTQTHEKTGPMPPSQARMLDRVAGLELRLRVGVNGAKVTLLDEEALAEAIGEEIRARTLGQLFTPDWVRATVQEIFSAGLDEPRRRVGEVWSRQSLTDVGGMPDASTALVHEFASYDEQEDLARIVGVGRFNMSPDEQFIFEGGPALVEDQTLSFEQYWDTVLGRTRGHQVVGGLRIRRLDTRPKVEAIAVISSEARMVLVDPEDSDFADGPFREVIGLPEPGEDPDEEAPEGEDGRGAPGKEASPPSGNR